MSYGRCCRLSVVLLTCLFPLAPSLRSEPVIIEVNCQKSFFTPDRITVAAGVPVRLILKSKDVTHGFAIDEFGIAREVPPGRPVTVEFTPDRPGSFVYYCVVRCGKNHLNMRGVLIVQ